MVTILYLDSELQLSIGLCDNFLWHAAPVPSTTRSPWGPPAALVPIPFSTSITSECDDTCNGMCKHPDVRMCLHVCVYM